MCKDNNTEIELMSIHDEIFSKYGWILEKPCPSPTIETGHVRQWFSIAPMDGFLAEQSISYFETKKVPIECRSLECVFFDDEAYINIGESRSVLFVALPDRDGGKAPDENSIKAFLIPPGVSVIVKHGVWHWSPYPVDCDNRYLLMLAGRVYKYRGEQLWVNEDYVVFKDLQNTYTIKDGI